MDRALRILDPVVAEKFDLGPDGNDPQVCKDDSGRLTSTGTDISTLEKMTLEGQPQSGTDI